MAATSAPLAAKPAQRGGKIAAQRPAPRATYVSSRWQLPAFTVPPEEVPTETLADALDAAYRGMPELEARRYELRAADEDYAQALAQLRPTTQVEVSGSYNRTVPGDLTQSSRSPADQLASPNITSNTLGARLIVDQPLYTGGKASADARAATHAILAGREQLRRSEGDLFLAVITAYADIRRDTRTLALRSANLRQLQATLDEVIARREAGELTLTDIAQAQAQQASAEAQYNAAAQQLEQDRASYAALVGHDAGVLAPEPDLPQLPHTVDAAFDLAQRLNPDLAQAIAAERASHARIAAAAAEGRPRLTLRGTAGLTGQAVPLYWRNEDQVYSGQAQLTIPITNGGRVSSLVEQARDRNAADRSRIESARRTMVQSVVNAWNAVATAQRNITAGNAQLRAARILDEGTFEEYRAGLRSTFDVLFAHGSLRDAEITLVNARHDLYVAEATLLRYTGMLEARTILSGTPLYDPEVTTRRAARRGSSPWDPTIRALDRLSQPKPAAIGLEQPPRSDIGSDTAPAMLPASPMPTVAPTKTSPATPLPGTTGVPRSRKRLQRP